MSGPRPVDPKVRFGRHVDKHGPYTGLAAGRCWDWTGATSSGRGRFGIGSAKDGTREVVLAYLWLWEQEHGPVPDGLELDHLCRRPICIRDSHLEPVPHVINCQRGVGGQHNTAKTHCPGRHPYSGNNLYIDPSGRRHCRVCRRERQQSYRERKAA